MKKLLFISFALAFFWGCEKVDSVAPEREEEVIEGENPDKETVDTLLTDYELPDILYASMSGENEEEPQTRTYVDNGVVLWQNGDAVSYFAGNIHNARYLYTGDDGLSKVELSKDNEKVGTTGHVLLKSQAVYPYNDNITAVYEDNIDKINLAYPVTQKYGVNSFGKDANIMVAAGTHNSDDNLYFRNACGYLVIKLYGSTKVKSIILSSVNGIDKIAGPAVVVASSDAAPVITLTEEASTAVTLDCSNGGEGVQLGGDKEHATEFWFALPPVSFTDGIKIIVNDVNGNTYTKQTSNEVNIVRNEVQPMAALEFVSNTPAATKLWYTRSDDNKSPLAFYDGKTNPFNATIKANGHYYDEKAGKFVIEFTSPLTTIQTEAFRDTEIATINMPEGVTTIEEGAFENSHLREITIPGSMNNIGINVFYNCDALESVTFLPSPTKTPLNIGCMDWTSEWGPFYDSPLTSIDLNRELICVWEDGSTFTPGSWDEGMFANEDYESVSSVSVTLGPQVETLSKYMFAKLPIQTLTIPGSVTTIQNDVFYNCKALTSLTFEPSPSGTALTMGYDTDGEAENLFQDSCPLATLNLNREINYTLTGVDTASEGLFGGMPTLTNVTLGDQVKTLHKYVFAGSGIQSIAIPAGITSIGEYAFDACSSLTDLTFETSETALEIKGQGNSDGPFYDSPLTTINYNRNFHYKKVNGEDFIPSDDSDGIFAISEDARNKVTTTPSTVNIGGLIETIQDRSFCNLPITELTIPGTVTSIGNNVFNGCNRLATLTFKPSETSPATGITLGYNSDGEQEGPFLNSPLTSVNLNREISYTLASIDLDYDDEGIFYGKSLAEGVIIGEQVRTLSDYMFSGSGITSLAIPATLTKIGAYTFNNCTNLTTLTFEESTTPLEIMGQGDSDGPFYDSPLTTINYNRNFHYKKVNGEDFIPSDDSDGIFAISNDAKNKITGKSVVTIGELIQTIPDYMCNNLAITELTIPNTVANLGMHAFGNCDRLSNITIQDDTNSLNLQTQSYGGGPFYNSPLTDIYLGREILYNGGAYNPGASGSGIFYSVNSAKVDEVDLSISNNVQTISPYMFAHLKLKSITIPASITSIGLNAFVQCQSLNSIVFEDSTTPLTVSCHHTWSILGPFHQSPLTSITLGRKINYVDSNGQPFTPSETDHGFFASEHEVESLSITLTNNVQTISEYMFAGRPITEINIPDSVTEIKDHAFQSCTKLASLTIPGTVNTIGNDVFNECTSLASVTFEPSSTKEALKIGYDTDGEDENLFQDSNSLTTLNLDRELDYTLTGIDTESEGLFGGMKNLTSVTLGDQVKTLFPYMFAGTGITELVIPGTVNEIKDFAFYNCEALEDLHFEWNANALTLGFQDFNDELGPFYQSPLKYIKLERDIEYNDNYAASCDGWDEGAFSNEYYDSDDYNWTARVIIGEQVTTLPKYMFATMRMQQLHIPESVENIGKGLVEKCEVLNAIVLYDTVQRPTNVEDGAFGEGEAIFSGPDSDPEAYAPGNLQYYLFVPYERGHGANGIYHTVYDEHYWNILWGHIMVENNDSSAPHIMNGHESRYYDKEKGEGEAGIIPGYEWYYQRYYLRQDTTPPTE